MKKIIICLLAVVLLAGCSNRSVAEISDKDTIIWKNNKDSFTSNDLYEKMKTQDYTSLIVGDMIMSICEKEGIDSADTTKEIEDTYNSFVEMGYQDYLDYYYGTKEDYINSALKEGMTYKLVEKCSADKYEEYVEEYVPFKAEIAYFDTKEAAEAVIEAVKNNENTFAYSASENGYANSVSETIYTDDSDLPVEVKEVAEGMSTSGLSSVITTSVTSTDADGNSNVTPRYYVVNMIETNPDNFKDEFITYISNTYLDQTEVINDYIKKYEIKVYDQDVYDTLVKTYDGIGY